MTGTCDFCGRADCPKSAVGTIESIRRTADEEVSPEA